MKLYLPSILLFLILGCSKENNSSKTTNAILKLPEKIFDFGKISQKDTINHRFELINNSEVPLTIRNVSASCGCTVPSWDKEPIAPSKKGFINITYIPNSSGQINKSIVVETNTDSVFNVLYLKGFVKETE